jgi:hypothetical protein
MSSVVKSCNETPRNATEVPFRDAKRSKAGVTDPVLIAQARAQRQRFDCNWAWFEAHAANIYKRHRGRFLAIAGQKLFVGDTVGQVLAQARAAHPEDDGLFTRYIPRGYEVCPRNRRV